MPALSLPSESLMSDWEDTEIVYNWGPREGTPEDQMHTASWLWNRLFYWWFLNSGRYE